MYGEYLGFSKCIVSLIYILMTDKHVHSFLKDIPLGRRAVFSTAEVVRMSPIYCNSKRIGTAIAQNKPCLSHMTVILV